MQMNICSICSDVLQVRVVHCRVSCTMSANTFPPLLSPLHLFCLCAFCRANKFHEINLQFTARICFPLINNLLAGSLTPCLSLLLSSSHSPPFSLFIKVNCTLVAVKTNVRTCINLICLYLWQIWLSIVSKIKLFPATNPLTYLWKFIVVVANRMNK